MNSYSYDPTRYSLTEVSENGEPLSLTLRDRFRGVLRQIIGAEEDNGNVDRQHFISDTADIDRQVATLGVEIASPADTEAHVIKLPRNAQCRKDEARNPLITPNELQELSAGSSRTAKAIRRGVREAHYSLAESAKNEVWWGIFNDKSAYEYNPFAYDPTEQLVIGEGSASPVVVYNFGTRLKQPQINAIVSGIDTVAQLTNGHSKTLVPNIVIHEAFKNKYFERSGVHDQPAGQAWSGYPFIELNRQDLEGAAGSAGQTWLEQVVSHEIHHQVDASLNPSLDDFARFFHYVDANGDKIIDYIVPKDHIRDIDGSKYPIDTLYDRKTIDHSAPCRDYGKTSAAEDLAVTSEEAPFGGEVDPIRRDIYTQILQEFVMQYERNHAEKLGKSHPDYARLSSPDHRAHPIMAPTDYASFIVTRRTGKDIIMPTLPQIYKPVKITFAYKSGVKDWLKHVM